MFQLKGFMSPWDLRLPGFAKATTRMTGKTLWMLFEKPSLRTRVSFETGMTQMGGHAISSMGADGKIGVRESVEDVARNIGRWVDAAMLRTFSHQLVVDMARYAGIPVINGLTDLLHPCQALADYLTLQEVKGELRGRHLVYVGDGNNVAHSLLHGGARLGVNVTVITPEGYGPRQEVVDAARRAGEETGLVGGLAAAEAHDSPSAGISPAPGARRHLSLNLGS